MLSCMQATLWFLAPLALTGVLAGSPRVVTVAQSGTADVVGNDNVALQKAARMLKPGDTLQIGPGTYEMNNSLFVPSGVTVRGTAGKTILMKSRGVESALTDDGDYGENILRVAEPEKFRPGMGIAVAGRSVKGWMGYQHCDHYGHSRAPSSPSTRVPSATTTWKSTTPGCATPSRSCAPSMPRRSRWRTSSWTEIARANAYIDGCRGGAIYLYSVQRHHRPELHRAQLQRRWNFIPDNRQCADPQFCESYGHAGYGIHPGTGSERPLVKGCRMHDNGQIGLFLCWRVKHGSFEDNTIQDNGRYGISIGHKDTDNVFVNNTIARNGSSGVYFRQETMANSGHRNTFRNNQVLDNGRCEIGLRVLHHAYAGDLVIENNQIAETRKSGGTQRIGIYKAAGAGSLRSRNNTMSGHLEGDYRDGAAARSGSQ